MNKFILSLTSILPTDTGNAASSKQHDADSRRKTVHACLQALTVASNTSPKGIPKETVRHPETFLRVTFA